MPQQPAVTLTDEDSRTLETFVHRGKANARTLTRARILLKSAEGWSTAALAEAFDVCEATVTNVRRRFAQGGLEAVLHDKVQQHRRSALSGLQTAHLIAVACSPAPNGHDHWTVRLLAQKAVELGFVTNISPNTIHELLKKTNSSRGSTNTGVCRQSEASLSPPWKTCWTCMKRSMTRAIPRSAWMRSRWCCMRMSSLLSLLSQVIPSGQITSMNAEGRATCLCWWSRWLAGGTWR